MRNFGQKFLLFIIYPFGGFLESFSNPRMRSSRIIIYLWFILWGMSFMPKNDAADSYRYANDFNIESSYQILDYVQQIEDYFFNHFETNVKDIYTLTMNYVVSRVTDNVHFLFMAFAIVFGFFYVKSMKFVLPPNTIHHEKLIFPILFLLFCFSNPIFNINGVRFWTAAWIAVYMIFNVCLSRNYLYLLLSPLLIFIHGGFMFFIIILLVYLISSRFHKIWNILFVISLIFTASSFTSILDTYSNILPTFIQNEIINYASDEALNKLETNIEKLPLYAYILTFLPRIIINVFVSICLLKRSEIEKNINTGRVLDFLVVIMSFVNFTMSIPSVGVRYINLVIPFLVYILIMSPTLTKEYKLLVYLIPIAYSYSIWYWIRNMISVSELYVYTTPLPFTIFHYLF